MQKCRSMAYNLLSFANQEQRNEGEMFGGSAFFQYLCSRKFHYIGKENTVEIGFIIYIITHCIQPPRNGFRRLCESACGHGVFLRTVGGQHLSRYCDAVGDEFLDAADRKDGRRMGISLYGS